MDDVVREVARLRAHLAALEARFGLAPVGTDPPPPRKSKEQNMRLTIIEDGLTQAERQTNSEMNAVIRKAAGRGTVEAPVFGLTPRQQASQAASRRISDEIRAAAGGATVVRSESAPDPQRPRRLAGAAEASAMNRLIREAAGRPAPQPTTTSPEGEQS